MTVLPRNYYLSDQTKYDKVGAHGTHEGDEKCTDSFGEDAKRKQSIWKTQHTQKDNITMYLTEMDERMWTALIWLRIWTSGSLF